MVDEADIQRQDLDAVWLDNDVYLGIHRGLSFRTFAELLGRRFGVHTLVLHGHCTRLLLKQIPSIYYIIYMVDINW